ncbi:MAG: hypothetical protein KC420_21905, partial [Myxococcales bacterium]|nr:hypothetical protein [Myxococcales bacterium]
MKTGSKMTMIKNATTLTLLVALAPIACSMAGEGTSNSASACVGAGRDLPCVRARRSGGLATRTEGWGASAG